LPLQQRAILQQAAVVGHTFWDRVVVHIGERSADAWREAGERGPEVLVPEVLSTLRDRDLVARHEASAFDGSQEFVFKHVALRQVAYESILKKVRRGYHSLVADWLREQSGERAAEYGGLIAEHLALAGRTEEALGYLRQAGEQAAARFANAEAVDYTTRALALLDQLGWDPRRAAEARFALLLAREAVYDLLGRRAEQAADLSVLADLAGLAGPAEEGTPETAAMQRRAEVARRRAWCHQSLGEYEAALASAEEAIRWSERAGDAVGLALGLSRCGFALARQGRYDQARGLFEQALALARQHDDRPAEASSLHALGIVAYYQQGSAQAAVDHYEGALQIRRELGDLRGEASSLNNLALVFQDLGDPGLGGKHLERVLAICQSIGDRPGEACALANLGLTYGQMGALDQARDLFERALALDRLLGDRRLESEALFGLGCVSLEAGDPVAARLQYERSLALCRQIGYRHGEGAALTYLAFALAELGELDAALGSLEEALGLHREMGLDVEAVDVRAGLAVVTARQGRSAEALAYARESVAWMAAHGESGVDDPVRAYVHAADALAACGQQQEAAAAMAAARALVQGRAARIVDPELRAGFLANLPLNARVLRGS
jgi:tetratricopeptide (TPR) repeat protein